MDPPQAPASLTRKALLKRRISASAPALASASASASADLVFHVISWHAADATPRDELYLPEDADDDEEDDDDEEPGTRGTGSKGCRRLPYQIHACGVMDDGTSVGLLVTGFTPFFYVRVPEHVAARGAGAVKAFRDALDGQCLEITYTAPDKRRDPSNTGYRGAKVYRRGDFWGFSHGAQHDFIRLTFGSQQAMRRAAFTLRSQSLSVWLDRSGSGGRKVSAPISISLADCLYESNIDPLLRFFHVRNLAPAGWVRVPHAKRSVCMEPMHRYTCQRSFTCHWEDVTPFEREQVAPLLMAGFDIECNSAHGDFPQARKDYRKLAIDLDQAWDRAGLHAASEYQAKQSLATYMRAAFGMGPQTSPPMARLQLKRGRLDVRSEALIDQRILHVVDDAYTVLRTGGTAAAARRSNQRGADDDDGDDDAGDAEDAQQSLDTGLNQVISQLLSVLETTFGRKFPLCGDEIIQIGTTFSWYGESECCARVIYTLGTCDAPPPPADPRAAPIIVRCFKNEAEMLVAWRTLITAADPDVMLGYNVFGFDFHYMHVRAVELMGEEEARRQFLRLGRIQAMASPFVEQSLSSSALGDNVLRYIDMQGRITIDLMKVVQRDHRLDSYRLDVVAGHFLGLHKHDLSPQDVFRLQRGTSADRLKIAEYCIQDCELCNRLTLKLQLVANNMGMANVCSVPLSFIFMRGQGVKILSLVAKQCRLDQVLIPARTKAAGGGSADDDGYEGAIVLEPECGMYLEDPVSVLDYNSLYPSSMISHNISHDTLVLDRAKYGAVPGVEYLDVTFDLYEGKADKKVRVGECSCRFAQGLQDGERRPGVLPRILQRLLGARKATRRRMGHVRVSVPCSGDGAAGVDEVVVGELRWGDQSDGAAAELVEYRGAAPSGRVLVLTTDQAAAAAPAYNAFECAVLDGLQLAYKVTANSLYGQMGARTSALYLKEIAACTTAVGRSMIMQAKSYVESPEVGGRVIYGDTDSIFIVFKNVDPLTGEPLRDKAALASSIRQGQAASRGIAPLLRAPHNLEYEKTLFPLILLSKKRYVGLLYESDAHAVPKQKSMGIALKRRDYAPIVKKIYGGVLEILLRHRDVPRAVDLLQRELEDLAQQRYNLADLIISKTLRAAYKIPQQIAHWVLSRRMYERDPGSAPQVNDRVQYVFVESTKADAKMGDRIEHVDWVRAHTDAVRVDIKTYIENQICKPCVQLLAIALEQLPGYTPRAELSAVDALDVLASKAYGGDLTKARKRLNTLREREVYALYFDPVLRQAPFRQRDNRVAKQHELHEFWDNIPPSVFTPRRPLASPPCGASEGNSNGGSQMRQTTMSNFFRVDAPSASVSTTTPKMTSGVSARGAQQRKPGGGKNKARTVDVNALVADPKLRTLIVNLD